MRPAATSGSFLRALSPARPASERSLALALIATLILWNVPYGYLALYPFKLFATWLHETSHGLVMLATGAGISKLEVFRDTSGLAHASRGVSAAAQAAISSAGYMGTAFFGALFLLAGGVGRRDRIVLAALAVALALSAMLWVRNGFGLIAIGALAATFGALAMWGGPKVGGFVLHFIAAQSCINAVLDIRVLFGRVMYVAGQPAGRSDADTMSSLVGGPPQLWAVLWLLWSFALFYLALRRLRQTTQ